MLTVILHVITCFVRDVNVLNVMIVPSSGERWKDKMTLREVLSLWL